MHADGVEVLPAPAVESHHLPLRHGRREVGAELIAERPVLAPVGDERQRSQDPGPVLPARVVVAVHARQDLVRVVQLHLQNAFREKRCHTTEINVAASTDHVIMSCLQSWQDDG